jgi:hypothetical protein
MFLLMLIKKALSAPITKKYYELRMIHSFQRSRDSSVGIATGYGLDEQEGREFESR